MKKIVCLLLMTALVLGCVSAASASISATYSNGKIYVTNSGSGMTRVNMNGASTGYVLDSNHTTVVLTPPAGATSVTISGVTDPFFGGDGGSVTVNISGGGGGSYTSSPVTPTYAPVSPTYAPVTPTYAPVAPTSAPVVSGPSVYVGSYVNGNVTVSVAGINTPSAIYIDGVPTGIAISEPGAKSVNVGTLTPGTHTVELYTWNGVVSNTFTVGSGPAPTAAPHTHSWGSWTVIKAATCEGAGEQTHTCTICGASETQRISPLGHRYVVESENDRATNYRCSNCGKHMTKEKPVYSTESPFAFPIAIPTQSPGLTTVTRNGYGHILYDSGAMAVDYDFYRDVQDISTVIIEVAQDTRTGKPTEIGLYLDAALIDTIKAEGYTAVRYTNGGAVLNIALANVEDAWFDTDEGITYRVFTTDPQAAGGTMVKVEAELASGMVIQPSNTLTGIVLKGATDILVSQNGVYDVSR